MHIVELQMKLMEARGEIHPPNSSTSKYRPRTAAVQKDTIELLEAGVNHREVSDLPRISLREVARMEEDNQRRREFLATGNLELPRSAAVFTIYQR